MDKPFPAYDGDEPYVFVCYAHVDAKIAYPEIRWLRDQGVNIWYDEGIRPGAEFPEYIGKAILGASLVLFYVSQKSVNSRHCRDEVYFALDHDIPVVASHLVSAEMPPGLALSIGTTQGLVRYEMPLREYRQKLLACTTQLLAASGIAAAWCSNDTSQGKLVRGGAWNDNPYRFSALSQAPPMFREPAYGFRTIFLPAGTQEPAAAFAEVPISAPTDLYKYEVVSDEVFDVFNPVFPGQDRPCRRLPRVPGNV